MLKQVITYLLPLSILSCNSTDTTNNTSQDNAITAPAAYTKVAPNFNANNAFEYIKKQLAFGPRIPGTASHKACADWFVEEFRKVADTTFLQSTTLTLKDSKKTKVPCYNIIGSFNPEATNRVVILAHWDSRPWADMDIQNRDQPIPAADDGASGVGVILEIANVLKNTPINANIGVDLLLVDVEDYAKPDWGTDAYALGSQYWASNPHIAGYTAQSGILLDMVGSKNARFPIEGYSQAYARDIVTKVWNLAHQLGHNKYFVYEQGGAITDDHVPLIEKARIPTIDIINLQKNSSTGFGSHWHTHNDNIDNIDTNTLQAVGETVLEYIYTLK